MEYQMSYSTFNADLLNSDSYAAIADTEVYLACNGFSNIQRYKDYATQRSGIDLTFIFNGCEWKCDEKEGASYGINMDTGEGRILNTFAFELFTTNGQHDGTKIYDMEGKEGWLTADNDVADSYMLFWTDKFIKRPKRIPMEYTYALVHRQSVLDYLEYCGWNLENLRRKGGKHGQLHECWLRHCTADSRTKQTAPVWPQMVKRNDGMYMFNEVCTRKFSDGRCHFSPTITSGQFHVNIVIPRRELMRMSVTSGTIVRT